MMEYSVFSVQVKLIRLSASSSASHLFLEVKGWQSQLTVPLLLF